MSQTVSFWKEVAQRAIPWWSLLLSLFRLSYFLKEEPRLYQRLPMGRSPFVYVSAFDGEGVAKAFKSSLSGTIGPSFLPARGEAAFRSAYAKA
jgi:hypothetical protein